MSTGSRSSSSTPQPDADPPQDRVSAHVGLVCTHIGELRPLMKRLDRVRKYVDQGCTVRGGFLQETTRIAIVEARSGFARHRLATEILIREHRPAWVLSVGYSSALAATLHTGDLALANEIADTHGNTMAVDCRLKASRRIHVGRHVVADQHPLTARAKQELAEQSQAIAADTGSRAVAQVCEELSVKFMSIRAIVDEMQEDIPPGAADLFFENSSKAVGTALGSVLKGLRQVSELNVWRKKCGTAAENLDRYVAGVLLQIGESQPTA